MAPTEIAATQAGTGFYAALKDLFLYFYRKKKHIEHLEESLTTLLNNLISIKSAKAKIDQGVQFSSLKTTNEEYENLKTNIGIINEKTEEFIQKYGSMVDKNILNSFAGNLDAEGVKDLLNALQESKAKIISTDFFKLAKLRKDILKLSNRASWVVGRITEENLVVIDTDTAPVVSDDQDNNDLPVMKTYVTEVSKCLLGNGSKVGILGPVGVGKTTVLKKLRDQLIRAKSLPNENTNLEFDEVIFLEYSNERVENNQIVGALQKEIMLRLKIDHERTESISIDGDRIAGILRDKNYVLLIDDVSSEIDLEKLGVRGDHKQANVVIASSNKMVINRMVDPDHIVNMRELLEGDAWNLFQKIYATEIHDRRIKNIGSTIIKYCCKFPLEIMLVATYLKGRPQDEETWNKVKQALQSDVDSLHLMGAATLTQTYKLVYEGLDDKHKRCLLYGALFPIHHDIPEDYLFECWKAEGFIVGECKQELRESREDGKLVLNKLTDDYLLQEWRSDGMRVKCVRMPQYVRRMAIKLEYPGEENCVIWSPLDGRMPTEDDWENATRMSLIKCKSKLLEKPNSKTMCTLLMQKMQELAELPESFFDCMEKLRVLDLQNTKIIKLPMSICSLQCLKCLYLTECVHLSVLPPEVDQLKELELLDISGTGLVSLPTEIKDLTSLRCLRASYNKQGGGSQLHVGLGIITSLTNLEELCMTIKVRPQDWESIADEIASLEHLNTLSFNFPNMKIFDRFICYSKSVQNKDTSWGERTFRSFNIDVGSGELQHQYPSDYPGASSKRRLRLSADADDSLSSCGEIMKQANIFELIEVPNIKSLSELQLDNLEVCIIERCKRLKNIVDGHVVSELAGFAGGVHQNMKRLHLNELESLECIWQGPVVDKSLTQLTDLTLSGCSKLTEIFDLQFASTLLNLKYLTVHNCQKISRVLKIPSEIQHGHSGILNKLEKLQLSDLPKLESICETTRLHWVSLETIVVMSCNELRDVSTLAAGERLTTITYDNVPFDSIDSLRQWLCNSRAHGEVGIASTSSQHQNLSAACNNEITCDGEIREHERIIPNDGDSIDDPVQDLATHRNGEDPPIDDDKPGAGCLGFWACKKAGKSELLKEKKSTRQVN